MSFGNRRIWSLVLTGAIGILLLVWLSWLFRPPHPDAHVREIAAKFQSRTLVSGARQEGEIDIERTKMSIKAAWLIQADQSWEEYRRSVIEQFPDFKLQSEEGGKLVFVKHLPGDTFRVTLEKVLSQPLRVRVTFVGYPS